jgi:predicted exporter
MMMLDRRWRIGLATLALGFAATYAVARLEVTTDVTAFLAQTGAEDEARLSRGLANSDLTRTMVLSVSGPSEAVALDVAGSLASRLEADPRVAWVRAGLPEGTDRAFYDLYHPRRLLFLADRPDAIAAQTSDAGLRQAAGELKRRLSLPTGAFVKRVAPGDPLLAFPRLLDRLQAARGGGLDVSNGRFVADGHGIVLLATRGLEMAGVNRVALASEASIKADITRISVLGTLGVVALFVGLFRSPRFLLLGLLPLGAGVLLAVATTQLVFGRVHGVTLAFGSSLVGVCIDYPVHLFNHHTLDPGGSALRRVWPGVRLGALTTVVGFAGLVLTGFPGVREIALFGAVGVLTALVATRVLSAPLLPRDAAAGAAQRWLAGLLGRAVDGLAAKPRRAAAPLLAALLLCGLGLPHMEWLDDPQALYEQDPVLHQEQDRVRQRVSRVDGSRFVVALGATLDEALARNDAAASRLADAQAAGQLAGVRSLHAFLWAPDLQRANWAALQAQPNLWPRTRAALEAAGFVPRAFEPFAQALAGAAPEPLTFDHLRASPLAPLVESFVVSLEHETAVLTYLRGVHDPGALERAFADDPGVVYVDQRRILERAYRGYRVEVLRMVGVGLLAVVALLAWRYRRPRVVLAAFLPALLAAASTLAALSLLGQTLHLLHVTALLLVLSIGVDYGIFLAEGRRHRGGAAATLLSIALACLTTQLAFGLLALSSAPVLRALGLTIGIGVGFALFLAPSALALAPKEAP